MVVFGAFDTENWRFFVLILLLNLLDRGFSIHYYLKRQSIGGFWEHLIIIMKIVIFRLQSSLLIFARPRIRSYFEVTYRLVVFLKHFIMIYRSFGLEL